MSAPASGEPEHGSHQHLPETSLRAAPRPRRGHPGAAAETGTGARDQGLSPEPSPHPDRRIRRQEPVPVRPSESRHGGALPLRLDPRSKAAGTSRPSGRVERPPDKEPPDQGQHRQGQGICPGRVGTAR